MWRSRYVSVIDLSEGHQLLYNAFSDKFIVAKRDTSIEEIDRLLLRIDGLTEYPEKEIEEYKNVISSRDNKNDIVSLHINPTLDCNFRCWYCYEEHIRGSIMSQKTMDAVFNLIKLKTSPTTIRVFNLAFFGGEPLLYFNKIVKPLIDYSAKICKKKDIDFTIHFTTNGFLVTDTIINYLKEMRCSMQITLDGAKESHDRTRYTASQKGSYDKIIANINKLVQNGIEIVLRINYTHSILQKTFDVLNDLNSIPRSYRRYVSIDLQQVWQDRYNHISEFNLNLVKELTIKFIQNGFNATNHQSRQGLRQPCYGDNMNHLLVNYNGDIFRCTARDFRPEKRHGYIKSNGEIEWDHDKLKLFKTCKEKQTVCLGCRVAPLCGGGCRQTIMEVNNPDKCIYGLSEQEKDKMILDHFEDVFLNNQK